VILKLMIDNNCTSCELCDTVIPGLREELRKHKTLMLNTHNPNIDWERIADAMLACDVGSLTLGEYHESI